MSHIYLWFLLSYDVIGSSSWLVAKVGFWVEANSNLFRICITKWPCGATNSRVQQAVGSDGEHIGANRRRGSCQSQRPWISFLFICREGHSTSIALKGIKDGIISSFKDRKIQKSELYPFTPVWLGCWNWNWAKVWAEILVDEIVFARFVMPFPVYMLLLIWNWHHM